MSRVVNFWLVIFLLCCITRPALAQCVVQANFTYTGTCQGSAAHFTDNTTFNIGNGITSWLWDFGDGNSSALTNPNHTYATTGNFVVTLTVTTSQGCSDSEIKNITVGVPPVASFVINNNPVTCNDEFITYTNTSTGNGLTYVWNFDNGTTSTLQNPQQFITAMPISCINHIDNTTLHVTDVLGCTSTVTHNTLVQSRPSAELISASEHICAVFVNGAYEAEHTLFNMSFAGCLQSYIIDWGDGTPFENESTDSMSYSHVYHNYGYFPVVVYGVGNGGACQTVVFRDTVLIEITPTAGIIGPTASWTNGCAPFQTYFILNSTVTPTTTQTVIWGGTDTVTLPNTYVQGDTVWHTFTKSGCDSLGVMTPFNIVLTAENLCGSSFTTWGNYTVHRPPIARFNIPDTICKNDFVSFQNTTMRNLCGGWAFTQFNWRIYKNGILVVNSNALTPDATPTLPNLNYAFIDTGTYVITLTATDGGGFGCGSTQFSKTVFVQGTYSNFWSDTVCLGNPTMFYDSSYSVNGNLTSWHWDFGDGTQSTDTNAVHVFVSPGFQNVTLITFDSNNCSDTITKPVYVSPYPVAAFGADTVCIGSATSFSDSSYTTAIDSIISWTWAFGDGDSSDVQNPVHTYASAGFYDVTLIVSTSYSCPDTIVKAVYVSPFPTAAYTSDSVCIGNSTTFTDLSTTAAIDSLVFWSWDFGDNTVSNDTNPTHTFLTDGFHDVTLIVGSSIGCYDTIVNQVYVSPVPTANFVFDTVCLGYPVHFIDSSQTNSFTTITGWTWSFGDNDTSYIQSPNHLYHDTGYFNVTLLITTSLGCTDSISQSIYVNPYPIVNFTSTQVCLGGTTQFTDITTTSPIDHIISWDWDFGGGNTSNLQNPTFVFSTAGYHSVTLNTESAVGCFESVTHNAYVSPFPVADFNAPPTCIGNATVYNNQSSTTGIHPINQWYWTLGDGTTVTTQSPVHTYGDTGVYVVSLAVKTTLGCPSDTVYKSTYVSPYPEANFTFDTVCLTHPTNFTDLSHTIANDSIISHQWTFGDGNSSNLQNPQHLYADSGVFNVTLIIASSIGCTDTITKAVYVKPMPFPGFTASTVCFGNSTVFSDTSSHSAVDAINNWTWHFGDGNISAQQNPNHVYPDSGLYSVTLIISTDLGCADSLTKNVYVSPYPTALFTVDSVCVGNGSSFTESSITPAQDSIVSWQWDFGDGNQSNSQNPSYTYADTGHFNISLVVTTSISCTDTLVRTTYISPYPVSGFTADTACLGNTTQFTDTSATASIDSIITWVWSFGDGNSSAQQSPSHLYADTGFYNVIQIVTSYYGCADTTQKNIYVKPLPTPDFSVTTSCFGFATVFSDSSYSSVVDTINNWVWQFGDGNTSNLQNPSHVYGDSGLYQVTLTVSSAIGCSDSITQVTYVSPAPVAVFKADTVCVGNATNFTDSSYTLANDSITGWEWDFGDSNTSAFQNPAHTYADTGHFNVTLVITTSIGCTDTLSRIIYISPFPNAGFMADTACLGFATSFSDTSNTAAIDNITMWKWDFGDGNTSTLQNPQHIYADSGNYIVILVVGSSIGCTDTVFQSIYVNAPPKAGYTNTTECLGYATVFTDTSTTSVYDYITDWTWNFGDGNSSVVQNPIHTFADSGIYNVSLIVNSSLGCSDTVTVNVYVSPYPVAVFSTDTVCLGNTTHFTDSSFTPANDNITGWSWDFGDGATSSLQNPAHTYTDTGYFDVSLIVTSAMGCSDTLIQHAYVSAYPTAAFTADTTCLTWASTFTDLSHTPAIDSIINLQWDFGDGQLSTLQHPQHTYADSGYYLVSLVVTSTFGCSDTTSDSIYVKPLPVPNFTAPSVCYGNSTVFTDSSFSSFVDTVSLWNWHFGDGNTSNTQNPLHLFADTGWYATTLIVSSSIGCTDSITKNVYVSPFPIADFNFDTVCTGSITSFTDLSYTPASDSIVDWQWSFGDNTFDTVQNPTHLYSDTGYFDVKLIVSSSIGCTDSITQHVYVSARPVADFTADSACFGFETSFSDISYSMAFDSINGWLWDFGDGNSSQLQSPLYIYSDTGIYTVSLICYSQIGCSDTSIQNIYVKPLPEAGFSAEAVCLGNATQFADSSVTADNDYITAWLWQYENSGSSLQNPSFIFSDTGTFNVTLIAYSYFGCSDTVSKNVYVSPYPVADFSADTVCMGYPTNFTDLSTVYNSDSITDWFWDFGDGNTSTLQNTQHVYNDSGFYNVTLIISTSIGCQDTISRNVYVSPSPIANFSASTVCLNNPTVFNDSSFTFAIDTIQTWLWDFGDGNSSALQNPQHIYADTGFYTVSLTIESTIGCPNTVIKDIYVSAYPKAEFTADTVCLNNPTTLADLSYTLAVDSIYTWSWQFGDGNASNTQNTTHIYADTGHFTVQLLITSYIGCADSINHSVYVSPYPVANFTADTACMGDSTAFTDLSYTDAIDNITGWNWDFGDGSNSGQQHPVHLYSTSGIFNATLIVSSEIGCSDTITKNVYVSPLPMAHFTADTVCIGAVTTFNDLSNTTAVDSVTTWSWDFGDGHVSALQNTTNLYADTGVFTVSLSVTTSLGCADTIAQDVYVSPMPHAFFVADTACIGNITTFIDSSYTQAQDIVSSWQWQFGDASTSNIQNSTHIYPNTGNYNVTLTVASGIGCLDSITQMIYISPYPSADFTADTACLGGTTAFTNLSFTNATDSLTDWEWDFGDGQTSGQQNPAHAYSTSGIFHVTLIAGSSIGCTDTITKDIYVSPPPAVLFSADTACLGFNTTFTDLTSVDFPDSIISWTWDFGDGDTSIVQNPSHLYADSGFYQVSLTIFTLLGCSNADTLNVYVKPLPVAGFEALPVCLGIPTLFNDSSTTAINDSLFSWYWDFGDGSTSNLQNPSHLYADTGTFNVMLVVSGYNGCSDTVTGDAHVIPLPIADFSVVSVCFGNAISCNDLTDSLGYYITGWHWDFGDGDTSSIQQATHNYQAPGSYQITLTVYNEHNCADTFTHSVQIYDIPVPDFGFDDVCLNVNTPFTDSSTVVTNAIVSWQWTFDDGDSATVQNPLHLYANSGSYNVSLTVTDSVGCTDSVNRQVTVYPLPVAAFAADSICSGDTAYFSDLSTTSSGSISSWQWDFGDATGTALIQNPAYMYDTVINMTDYNVSLIVSNSWSCLDTLNQYFHINPLPVVLFSADTACFGNATAFSDLSYSNGGAIDTWQWDFGDGIGSDTVSNPSYLYNNIGFFNTELQVTDLKGCTQSTIQAVLVDSLPIPSFTWCQVCLNGQLLPVTFVNTSQGNGSTIAGNYWTFGNGQSSVLNDSVTENYQAAGSYDVTLINTNDRGCSDSITQTISVHSGLSVDFTIDFNCFDVSFNATSNNATSLIEWQWDFGDGSYSNQHDSAQHTYFQPGTYLITLTVYDSLPCLNIVCQQSVSHYIYVYPAPIADFSAPNVLVGISTVFTDLSTAPQSSVVSWAWDFGDGTSSTLQNPTHTYLQYGVYDVTLTIENGNGCSQSITQQIIVYPALIAEFDSATVCAQTALTFNNTSQVLLPGITVSWLWDFDDGQTSTDSLPTHTFNLPGVYNVMLIVSLSPAVADTAIHQITVIEAPVADFTFTEVCLGDTLTSFYDNSYSSQPLVQWRWELGDSSTSTQPNVNHFYLQWGTYDVLLVVQNSFGCTDSINKNVRVFDVPEVNFDASPQSGCLPLTVAFNDLSTVNDATLINWEWTFGDSLSSVGNPVVNHTYNTDSLFSVSLTVMSDKGCKNTLSIPNYIQVFPVPNADFTYTPTVPFSTDLVQFNNNSTGCNAWLWDFGDGDNSIIFNPHHIFDEGFFTTTLVAYNQYSCTDTAYREIFVRAVSTIYAPNSFTPLNQDGLNDIFMIKGTNLNNFELRIFNRYGQQIFYSDDVNKGWDGKFKGRVVPIGTYVWKVWYTDSFSYKQEVYGTVSVVY